jgi:peptidoglycan/xylan/chitin deacetylase (PgdA/CDA1 family)
VTTETPTSLRRRARALLDRHSAVVGSVTAVRTTAAEVVLTFDDGPEPGGTDKVLQSLAAAGATATFFVLLTRVRRFGHLLDEVRAAGHEIALHGVDHQALTGFRPSVVRQRTADARDELEQHIGRPVRWFRPPYGRQTLATWRAVRRTGLTPVFWGPTTWDWRDITQDERVAKAQQGVQPGAIVLAHDGFAGPMDAAPAAPVPRLDRGELVTRVLAAYADRGLSAHSLDRALSRGAPVLAARFRR